MSRDPGLRNRLLIGAVAGLAGALAVGMAVRRVQRRAGDDGVAGTAASLACGAACGSLLAASSPRAGLRAGAAAGTALWVATHAGCAPAGGVVAPAGLPPKRRNLIAFGAHLFWGAATALVARTLIAAADERGKP